MITPTRLLFLSFPWKPLVNMADFGSIKLEPGQVSPYHCHPNCTEIYFCYEGGGTMRTPGETIPVVPGSFVVHPTVERIVICELEPLIPKVVAEHFSAENYGVVKHKKVEVTYDDARHYIFTTREWIAWPASPPGKYSEAQVICAAE